MKDINKFKNSKRTARRAKIRAKITGTPERPRLNIFRSNKNIFLQLIDDTKGVTLVSVHTTEMGAKAKNQKDSDQAFELGKLLAKKAQEKNIKQAVFDRGGYRYHGKVSSVADGARDGGLEF